MKDDSSKYFLVAIVAAVAIVGLIVLYMYVSKPSYSAEGAIAGQAYVTDTKTTIYDSGTRDVKTAAVKPFCTDYDGFNFAIASHVKTERGSFTDRCNPGISAITITEYTCENGKEKENNNFCDNGCLNGRCPPTPCYDTDGYSWTTQGTLYATSPSHMVAVPETCSGSTVTEYYCDSFGGGWRSNPIDCEAQGMICQNGACVTQLPSLDKSQFSPLQMDYCIDNDKDSEDPYYTGSSVEYRSGSTETEIFDTCGVGGMLTEVYCDGTTSRNTGYQCPDGCANGACITTTDPCTDSDGGADYQTKGFTVIQNGYYSDSCSSSTMLLEHTCDTNGNPQSSPYDCTDIDSDFICDDGACIDPSLVMSPAPPSP